MSAGLNLLLVASAALFAVGVLGVVTRRSAVVMLLGTQFMFIAGALVFVAFARFGLGAARADAGATMAFFAGAQHLFGSIMTMLDQDADVTEADLGRLSLIDAELQSFAENFAATIKTRGSA